MPIGLTIFLTALIFGVVLLYGITREGLKWAPSSRRIALGVAATILIAGVVFSIRLNFQKIGNPFWRQTTYTDLILGMTMADVRYVKGNPKYLRSGNPFYDLATGFTPTRGMSDAKIDAFIRWYYENSQQIEINFNPSTRRLESIGCEPTRSGRCPLLFGVRDGATEATVINRLGKPSGLEIENGTKTIAYDNLGVWFSLENGKITGLGIGAAN